MRNKRVLGLVFLTACLAASAQAVFMVHEFYLPLPEAQVLQAFRDVDSLNLVKAPLESVTSIVVTGPDTIIHYDHWEDGYETDINNPTQPTTQIWGDGNDANGIPPGYASDPMGLPQGAVIPLRNNVNLPRNPSQILYDGRDRITASKALAVSRALWPVSVGTVLSEAVEVAATIDHGTHYIAPVGEDVDAFEMFEQVGLAVMADQDNTVVTIDKDGPGGAAPTTVTLNQGESHFVSGGVLKGAEVTATKPVQVHLLTGDTGATYETRWYTLFPVEDWFSRYVTPIGSSANGQACYVFLYNPGPSPSTPPRVSAQRASRYRLARSTAGRCRRTRARCSAARVASPSAPSPLQALTPTPMPPTTGASRWCPRTRSPPQPSLGGGRAVAT